MNNKFDTIITVFMCLIVAIVSLTLLTQILLYESLELIEATPLIASITALLGTTLGLAMTVSIIKKNRLEPEPYSTYLLKDSIPEQIHRIESTDKRIQRLLDEAIIKKLQSGDVKIKVPSMIREIEGYKYIVNPEEITIKKIDLTKTNIINEEEPTIELDTSIIEKEV